jgi:hypothetical protein
MAVFGATMLIGAAGFLIGVGVYAAIPEVWLLVVPVAVPIVVGAIRFLMMGVSAGPKGLVVRSFRKTNTIAWPAVRDVELGSGMVRISIYYAPVQTYWPVIKYVDRYDRPLELAATALGGTQLQGQRRTVEVRQLLASAPGRDRE